MAEWPCGLGAEEVSQGGATVHYAHSQLPPHQPFNWETALNSSQVPAAFVYLLAGTWPSRPTPVWLLCPSHDHHLPLPLSSHHLPHNSVFACALSRCPWSPVVTSDHHMHTQPPGGPYTESFDLKLMLPSDVSWLASYPPLMVSCHCPPSSIPGWEGHTRVA